MHTRRTGGSALVVARVALSGQIAPAVAQDLPHARLFPPEDLGLLEGPDRSLWQKPDEILDALNIADGPTVAAGGAGAGRVTGRLAPDGSGGAGTKPAV